MSTHSRIGIELPDGHIESIYCHWDGYPSNNGRILFEHYQEPEKVLALIGLGDLSSLGNVIGEQHSFDDYYPDSDPRSSWCCAYGRDRGEEGTGAKTTSSLKEFWQQAKEGYEEYVYLYRQQEGAWYWSGTNRKNLKPMTPGFWEKED